MQIRPEQVETFRQLKLKDFENRALAHLRKHLPQETAPYSDDDLRRRVQSCVVRAQHYGLNSERGIVAFVDATYLQREDFDANPSTAWARPVLTNPALNEDEKITLLIMMAQSP